MANSTGTPIWYELLTPDPDAAQAFYSGVVGWTVARGDYPGIDYRIISAPDGTRVAGLMKQPEEMKAGPSWLTYLAVEDVDASVEAVEKAGGAVHMPARTLESVGRMAMVADPQGAAFYLMRGASDQESHAFAPAKVGHCVWNELVTRDQDAALGFYGAIFGWRKEGAMPMGAMGDYSFIHHGELPIGAMMNAQDAGSRPAWNFAFQVADIDAAKAAVEACGGTVRQGPMEIPGGDWLIMATDPQGAKVMFVASGKS